MFEYEGVRRVIYGEDRATFIPVCPKCGRFVQSDPTLLMRGEGIVVNVPNATCRKCGRVAMPFEGFV